MEKNLQQFISSIQESRLSNNDKGSLVSALQKNGITQTFADLFKESLSREAKKRGEAAATIFSDFDMHFARLLKQFEKENSALEQAYAQKISTLDPLDTAGEQMLLDSYATALKNQRNDYEKKVRDLSVQLSKASFKLHNYPN